MKLKTIVESVSAQEYNNLGNILSKHQYTVMTNKPIMSAIMSAPVDLTPEIHFSKPNGFWFSVKDQWYKYLVGNWHEKLKSYNYAYSLILYNDFVVFDHPEIYHDCVIKYPRKVGSIVDIDWVELSKDYSGALFFYSKLSGPGLPRWMTSALDCDCGLIWDDSAIKSSKLIWRRDEA